MLMELPSFHGTGSPAAAILYRLSRRRPRPLFATPHHWLFRHSAPVSPSPSPPHTLLPPGLAGRLGSLSDRHCHKPSYISPRVTKLRDGGDKVASAGGRSRRITSLAVCLSLILAAVWKSDCQPPHPLSSKSSTALSTIFNLPSVASTSSVWPEQRQ